MTRYHFSFLFYTSLFFFLVTACTYRPQLPSKGAYLVDSGGRHIATLDVGGSLEAGARGLLPGQAYNFELTLDGEIVSFARLAANTQGEIAPFHLWFYSGVVGCSLREKRPGPLPQFMFRNFDEAQSALDGRSLTLTISPYKQPSKSPRTTSATATALINDHQIVMQVGQKLEIPMRMRRSPLVYPSTENGCLLNSAEAGAQAMFVSGRHFKPGEFVEVNIAPNQHLWRVGDIAKDVTGISGKASRERVKADDNGRFTVKVWDKELQRRGAYDIITRRKLDYNSKITRIIQDDVISFGSDSAYILYLRTPPGGSLIDIAGRNLRSSVSSRLLDYPYFEFSDSFTDMEDDVWGVLDPTYIPIDHPGGRYAAYHIVNHRNVPQWATDTTLPFLDISGNVELVPVKAGSISASKTLIWSGTKSIGDYDVVVNFGSTPAETETAFTSDLSYDSDVDFLDGADQIGFRVAEDPHARGFIPIGEAEYSFDDELWLSYSGSSALEAASGTPTIDLRAVVRYPASVEGTNTPVLNGRHPVFIIEHGNHNHCNDGNRISHADCTSRVLNHRGYDELLNILASHGVIAISVDAYDLTADFEPVLIQERGDLILKHLEFWSHLDDANTYNEYTDPFDGLFQGHVDMSKISVSGHSRGGEAAIAAYDRNLLRDEPQRFAINSVSAIAPTDYGQGNGQSHSPYVLGDVPFLLILPAADCDVGFVGVGIYDRAGGASDLIDKSGVYIYGANHNFFNTVWADDKDDCETKNPNRIEFIPSPEQQSIGEAYLAAFVRAKQLNEDVYEDMFRGRLKFPSTAGRRIYTFHHEKDHLKLDAGSGVGTPAPGVMVSTFYGRSSNGTVHRTQMMKINWEVQTYDVIKASYAYTFSPGIDVTGYEVLAFRAAQTNNTINSVYDQELRIKLIGGGKERAVYSGRFDPIPSPYDLQGINNVENNNVMTTVRIPLHSFILNNSEVTLDNIDTVEFHFSKPTMVDSNFPGSPAINPSQGEIYIDDIEFSR